MNFKSTLPLLAIAFAAIAFTSCSKDDPAPAVTAVTFKDLAADPPSGGYTAMGQPIGVTKKYTLFSFKTGAIVANTDSTSATKWDIGFNGTNIIVNSGTSGPGAAAAQVVSGIFNDITAAPDDGYLQDNKNAAPAAYAIKRGSDNGWYHYDPATNVVSPIAGKVIIVHTADGKYAKMEILSYYQGAPPAPTSSTKDRYYTFQYLYQPNDSKTLK